jgi:V-type H+-transporting ATPase subunit a
MFGFMDLLIIVKWCTDWSAIEGSKPPSIISTMIVMCLGFGEQSDPSLKESDLIPYQSEIMKLFILIAIFCVPLMLLVKPVCQRKASKEHEAKVKAIEDENKNQAVYTALNEGGEEYRASNFIKTH